jgi:hypothetical protein
MAMRPGRRSGLEGRCAVRLIRRPSVEDFDFPRLETEPTLVAPAVAIALSVESVGGRGFWKFDLLSIGPLFGFMNGRGILFAIPMFLPSCGDASVASSSSSEVATSADAHSGQPASSETLQADGFIGVCTGEADLETVAGLGVTRVRIDRPSATTIEQARRLGIDVLPIVDYGFPDLSGHEGDDKYPPLPANRAAWSKRMIEPWRNMPHPPRVFEVWNEPWSPLFWKPQPDARAYLALVQAFAAEAWSVWPDATLLVSADNVDEENRFRDDLLAADTTGFLNDPRILPTTHNYVQDRSPTQVTDQPCTQDLDRFRCAYADFKAHGHPDPKVWVTEFGWESDTLGGYADFGAVTEERQAAYTRQALDIFEESGMVRAAYVFYVRSGETWNYDWLRPDSTEKPVCPMIRAMISGRERR